MKRSAQLILSALFFVLCILFVIPFTAQAQTTSYAPNTNSDVPDNSHTRAQVILIDLSAALICQLAGIDVINPQQGCLGIDPVTKKIGHVPTQAQEGRVGGLLGFSSQMIGNLYVPPASSAESVRYLASNFGIAKSAMAQENDGYNALSPLQGLWLLSRNLVFLILVVVFVLIGIGIMLRLKIDPRAVMTIQNQLPKIIIAIILITFSYSIVGFAIDLMWTGTYVIINTLGPEESSSPDFTVKQATSNLYNNPIYYLNDLLQKEEATNNAQEFRITKMSKDVGFTIGDLVAGIILSALGADGNIGDSCGIADPFKKLGNGLLPGNPFGDTPSFGECVEAAFFSVLSFFIGIIAILIVLIAILLALFRVWFALIKAYVYILLYTILAPFFILFGLLPNPSLSFNSWIRRIIAHLAVFPAVVGIFIVAKIFMYHEQINAENPTAFVPPLIGNPNIGKNIGTLIAFGLIMLAPGILDIIKDSLKAQGNSKVSGAVTGGFMAGYGPGMAPFRGIWGSLNRYDRQSQEAGALGALTHRVIPDRFRQLTGNRGRTARQWFTGRRGNNP